MADFFEEPDKTKTPDEGGEVEKIKLGDKEFSPDELQEMVGKVEKVSSFEKKSGTDFDSLTQSWGKRGERIGALEKEIETLKAAQEEMKKPVGDGEATLEQVQEQARKYGIVTKKDFDQWFEERVSQREQAKDLLKDCEKFEKKIDGKDGRPAFKTPDVLEFMRDNGLKDPNIAYKIKFEKELDEWKENQLSSKRTPGLVSEKSSTAGSKQPSEVRVTRDNLDAMVKEALYERSGGL